MRVKGIVIDGFKSYAHRKALDDLSPHFNAITGLNGSGKSNIFDAICFVMGITNLKRVRAEDPRELIFRAGTTGVHAARVTIEFINDDPRTAPPGYSCEEYPIITVGRQIKLGGKQQFFLNNNVSMQSKVKRFFESISLNVDNPHFMVLQGTIHKLIGMRSQDILSLIEEAVGTKAFDHRRRTAESLIRSKEKKMEEINDNIETQIGPMLRAMKADQDEYERYLQMSESIEEKRRFRIAFEYEEHRKELAHRSERRAALEVDVTSAKEQLRCLPATEDAATRRLMQLQDSLATPAETAVVLHEEESELKRQVVRDEARVEGEKRALRALESSVQKLGDEKKQQQGRIEQFAAKREQREELVRRLRSEKENVAKLKRSLELHVSGVRVGTSGMSLEEERADIDRQLIHHAAELRRCEERVKELERQLQHEAEKTASRVNIIAKLEEEVSEARERFDALAKPYAAVAPLEERAHILPEEIARLKAEHWQAFDALKREMANVGGGRSFDVEFDRRSCPDAEQHIHGRVAELIAPQDEKYSLALMVGAQTQLLRVVVTSDVIAEKIIRSGLRQRTSFLPLNTMQCPKGIDNSRLEEAKRIAARMGGFLAVAKDLTTVNNEAYHIIADSVYGQFLVCSSLALAQELAYNPAVRCKAVSLDGDVAEPNGLITGGSTQQLRDIFAEVRVYQQRKTPVEQLRLKIAQLESEMEVVQEQLRQQKPLIKRYKEAEEAFGLAVHKLQLERGNTDRRAVELGTTLAEERQKHERSEATIRELNKRREVLERHMKQDPDKARKELHEQLSEAQKRYSDLVREEEAGAAEFEWLEADTTQLAADLEQKMSEALEGIRQRSITLEQSQEQLRGTNEKLQDVMERRQRTEEQRQRLEKEIEEVQQELQQLVVKKSSLEGIVKNAEVDLRDSSKVVEELSKAIHEAERRHSWILDERHTFGSIDGNYYFNDKARTAATLQELREAESQTAVMSRRLNRKATILYEERKKEYDELVQQRSALGEDRDVIQQCILGIEEKKWQALDRMVKVVSSVFSKLFSTCLPGAAAVLREERDDLRHLCGLQVKVMFNGKEKESLSELSGGQRSLLALCLILAILRVRQAPMYILDEVDAALDPSHTQNIGRMLQTHFPTSQFLLVSLKDGMFNNADVLYQKWMAFYNERQKTYTVQGLKDVVQESLTKYMYTNAIFSAERLYALVPTYDSLHILAHCHVTSGDAGSAYRLLRAHYPFKPPTTTSTSNTTTSSSGRSGGGVESDTSTDALVQWKCQYLLGVTCGMTQRYMEGERILDELDQTRSCSEVQYWLGICRRHLHHRNASEAFAKSVLLDPLNFAAYEEHVKTAQPPRKAVSRMYADTTLVTGAEKAPRHSSSESVKTGGERNVKREAVRAHFSYFALVTSYLWNYQCRDAKNVLLHERFPEQDSGWVLGALAMAYFHDGDVENATKEFARMRQLAPWRLQDPVLVYYSTALWQRKEMGLLGSLSQTLIDEMPISPITLCVVANTYSLVKESNEALCMLNRAVQVDREFAYAHTLRGYELLYLDRKSEAEEAFQTAILIDSKHYNAYAGLGELYFRSENVQKARSYFQQAIGINPLPTIMNRYAATYHRRDASKQNLKEALRIYERAIERHPTNLGARHQRAEVLVRLGSLNEAHQALLRMTEECPDEAMLYVTLAKCVHLMGLTGQAVHYYHTAMDLDPRRVGYIKSCLESLTMGNSDVA